jgi:hypothetical protein
MRKTFWMVSKMSRVELRGEKRGEGIPKRQKRGISKGSKMKLKSLDAERA